MFPVTFSISFEFLFEIFRLSILSRNGWREYFTTPFNYIQLATDFLVLSLVPMRFLDIDEQFDVAAFAYILICLRMLDVVSITK